MSFAHLNQLGEGAAANIQVMVCRKWDVFTRTGTYISTDFVLSDEMGNVIHCTTKSNVAHRFINKLEEGFVYNVNDFNVLPNKKEFCIVRNNNNMIELHGGSMVKKIQNINHGFPLYPFDFTEIKDIRLSEANNLIEVIGYVTGVGMQKTVGTPTRQRGVSKTLDFHLQSNTGESIKVTLWDKLGDELLERKAKQEGLYAVILVAMHVKEFKHEVYISSTPSTLIYDSTNIPQLVEFRNHNINGLVVDGLPADQGPPTMSMTVLQMLEWCRDKKRDTVFSCRVRISDITTQTPWYYFACTSGRCKKGVTRRAGNFFCTSCELPVSFPKARFKLRLTVEDPTEATIVTLFDDTAEKLVGTTADSLLKNDDNDEVVLPNRLSNLINTSHVLEIKSHTYYSIGTESFTCTNILPAIDNSSKKRPRDGSTSALFPSTDAGPEKVVFGDEDIAVKTISKGNDEHQPKSADILSLCNANDDEESDVKEDNTLEGDTTTTTQGEGNVLPQPVIADRT